jgi:hypothetical protein
MSHAATIEVEVNPMPTGQQLKKLKEVIEANLVTPRPDRPRHDPATCRIYKCGMCAAMKEK